MTCCCIVQPATGVHCWLLGVASIPISILVCRSLIEVSASVSARGVHLCGLIHRDVKDNSE